MRPIYISEIMVEMFKELPSEIIENVSSYLIGEPKHVRLNNTEALKTIQKKYKIITKNIEITKFRDGKMYEYTLSKQTPFTLDGIEQIMKSQKDYIRKLSNDDIETLSATVSVNVDSDNHKCLTLSSHVPDHPQRHDLETKLNGVIHDIKGLIETVNDRRIYGNVININEFIISVYGRNTK